MTLTGVRPARGSGGAREVGTRARWHTRLAALSCLASPLAVGSRPVSSRGAFPSSPRPSPSEDSSSQGPLARAPCPFADWCMHTASVTFRTRRLAPRAPVPRPPIGSLPPAYAGPIACALSPFQPPVRARYSYVHTYVRTCGLTPRASECARYVDAWSDGPPFRPPSTLRGRKGKCGCPPCAPFGFRFSPPAISVGPRARRSVLSCVRAVMLGLELVVVIVMGTAAVIYETICGVVLCALKKQTGRGSSRRSVGRAIDVRARGVSSIHVRPAFAVGLRHNLRAACTMRMRDASGDRWASSFAAPRGPSGPLWICIWAYEQRLNCTGRRDRTRRETREETPLRVQRSTFRRLERH
ncbi:hypothetical protein C8Q76DRAFT_293272 [Earliella scabrosa]|nr:hypothetical protein C8Q76DRAFT_293272 [Earliella scabrosa]